MEMFRGYDYLEMIREDYELSEEEFAESIGITAEHYQNIGVLGFPVTKAIAKEVDKKYLFSAKLLMKVEKIWEDYQDNLRRYCNGVKGNELYEYLTESAKKAAHIDYGKDEEK